MNRRHWNTVILDGSVPDEELLELVVTKLPKRVQGKLTKEGRS